jgi:glycosyltransferase 2 family protein
MHCDAYDSRSFALLPRQRGPVNTAPPKTEAEHAPMSLGDAMAKAQSQPAQKGSKVWRWVGIAASFALLAVAVFVLFRTIRNLDPDDVRRGFAKASWEQIGLAVGFTALSYVLLTFYDVLALKQLRAHFIRYRTAAFASFTSYAISFTLGFPLLTAGAVRFWVYAPRGLSAQKIASLTLIAAVTFWLGMGLVIGISLIFDPEAISAINQLSVNVNRLIGLAIIAGAIAYVAWVAARRRQIRFQGFRLSLPNWRVTLGQMGLGVADVCAGGAVLYFLLPNGHDHAFEAVLAVYVFAHMLGVASHVPGGLGAFEATILLALSGGNVTQGALLTTLLLYRIVYYLIPFALAVAMLGLGEVLRRARDMRGVEAEDDDDDAKPSGA